MAEGRNGLILWLSGCLFTVIVVITLPMLANAIILNDRESRQRDVKAMDIIMMHEARLAKLDECATAIHEDLMEIKQLLKRVTPYERKF